MRLSFILILTITLPCIAHSGSNPGSISEPLIGAFFHLPISHNDGMGDVMYARELASQLQIRRPGVQYPVVVENEFDYLQLRRISHSFDFRQCSNLMSGVEVIRGQSARAQKIFDSSDTRIICLPASDLGTRFERGNSKFNLYYDEAGVPEVDMNYAGIQPRGKVIRCADTHHLRLNPGFHMGEYGVALPLVERHAPKSRMLLLKLLSDHGLKLDQQMIHAKWGTAYAHSQLGNYSENYYRAIYQSLISKSLAGPIVIFDFSTYQDASRPSPPPSLSHRFVNAFRRQTLQVITSHDPTTWIGRRSGSSLTVVRVGLLDHEAYLHFLKQADLPVAVTGTQSLLEAIALQKPFVYELVPWNMGLAFGMAEVAAEQFNGDEKRFLIDWILGRSDLDSVESVRKAAQEFGSQQIDYRLNGERYISALKELMSSSQRQASVTKIIEHLIPRTNFVDRLLEGLADLHEAK